MQPAAARRVLTFSDGIVIMHACTSEIVAVEEMKLYDVVKSTSSDCDESPGWQMMFTSLCSTWSGRRALRAS